MIEDNTHKFEAYKLKLLAGQLKLLAARLEETPLTEKQKPTIILCRSNLHQQIRFLESVLDGKVMRRGLHS
jgi:hypothetical protein